MGTGSVKFRRVHLQMCFTIIIKIIIITLIFHPKAPRLGIVAEYKLRRLFTKNWETLGGEHANLPSSSSSRLRWKENWKLQISCQSQTVWTRRLMTGAKITQFQTKSSLSPWPQASQVRPAILYRLIEELITRELIYRFLVSSRHPAWSSSGQICQVVIPWTVVCWVHSSTVHRSSWESRTHILHTSPICQHRLRHSGDNDAEDDVGDGDDDHSDEQGSIFRLTCSHPELTEDHGSQVRMLIFLEPSREMP